VIHKVIVASACISSMQKLHLSTKYRTVSASYGILLPSPLSALNLRSQLRNLLTGGLWPGAVGWFVTVIQYSQHCY